MHLADYTPSVSFHLRRKDEREGDGGKEKQNKIAVKKPAFGIKRGESNVLRCLGKSSVPVFQQGSGGFIPAHGLCYLIVV